MKLFYCANGNPRYASIALSFSGFRYGAQMPGKSYFWPEFVDLHPDRPPAQWRYIQYLRRWRPRFASVHDWHGGRDLVEIMLRAEEVATYVQESVLIIPKVPGTISSIPRTINDKSVILGYSVATEHGRTDVPIVEFSGWPVHLLGGNPHTQISKYKELTRVGATVISADGNIALKHANSGRLYWPTGDAVAKNRYWPTLLEADGSLWGDGTKNADASYEAFRRSCRAILWLWQESGIRIEA